MAPRTSRRKFLFYAFGSRPSHFVADGTPARPTVVAPHAPDPPPPPPPKTDKKASFRFHSLDRKGRMGKYPQIAQLFVELLASLESVPNFHPIFPNPTSSSQFSSDEYILQSLTRRPHAHAIFFFSTPPPPPHRTERSSTNHIVSRDVRLPRRVSVPHPPPPMPHGPHTRSRSFVCLYGELKQIISRCRFSFFFRTRRRFSFRASRRVQIFIFHPDLEVGKKKEKEKRKEFSLCLFYFIFCSVSKSSLELRVDETGGN